MTSKATTVRKLFAACGLVPLAAFVAVHVVTTSTGIGGPQRFERVFSHRAWMTAAIVVLVVLPLAFHSLYGAFLAIARPREAHLPGWLPRLRRTTALVTLAFVIGHVAEVPGRVWIGSIDDGSLFDVLSRDLSSTWHGVPFVALGYLVGTAATLAHFGLALWAYLPATGFVLATGVRRALGWALVVGGTLLFVGASDTILFFATGSRLFGPSPPAFVPDGPPRPACAVQ
jgi:succinate dehydrogenase/fumarate reductase cytochrome b subunit